MNRSRQVAGLGVVLGLGAAVRLVNLAGPLSGEHTWRQADTAAIARNFALEEFNLLHPRVDWRGDTPGYVECELPLYPFIVAMLYRRVGVDLRWGRLVSVGCSLTAVVGVFLLTAALSDPRTGVWAAGLVALSPLQGWLGHAVMPEALLLVCLVFALWLYLRHLRHPSPVRIAAAGLLLGIAVGIKPMMLTIGLPLAVLGFQRYRWRALTRWDQWAFLVLVLLPPATWFAHARRLREATGLTFGIWDAGEGKWGDWRLTFSGELWERILTAHLADTYLLWAGIPLVLWGAYHARGSRIVAFCGWWILSGLIGAAVVARGSYLHHYYLHPLIVPLMMLAAIPCSAFAERPHAMKNGRALAVLACLVFMAAYGAMRYGKFVFREDEKARAGYRLAEKAAPLIPAESLVVAVEGHSPLLLYQLHRKGWPCGAAQCTPDFLDAAEARGAEYLVGTRAAFARASLLDRLADILASPRSEVVLDDGTDFVCRFR